MLSDTTVDVIFDHHCDDQIVAITRACPICGLSSNIAVSRRRYNQWRRGRHARDIWTHVSRDHREIMISGTHPECWAAMFGSPSEGNE